MDQRKQKIVDKKFQLRATFSVMGVFLSMIAVVILTIGINIFNDNRKIEFMMEEQQNIIDQQSNIFNAIVVGSGKQVKSGNGDKSSNTVAQKCNENIESMKANIATLKDLTHRNNVTFLLLIFFFVSLGLLFFPVLIRRTHRISGPIFIMSKYINDILNGENPDLRPLRKNDDLKDFYDLFSRFVEAHKHENENKV